MNGPNDAWGWFGIVSGAASVVGLAVAIWAERRARADRRRAETAESRARAAAVRAQRSLLLRELTAASEAAKLCLGERSSEPAWKAHFQWFRSAFVRLESAGVLTEDELTFVRGIAFKLPSVQYRDPESDQVLRNICDRLEGLHGRLLHTIPGPDA